jgi:hypothetical protein
MNKKNYSYLPNKYTIKFFDISEKEQSKLFKPLLITDNIKSKANEVNKNKKELKISKKNKKSVETQIYNKENDLLIQKRKKVINTYLKTKTNINNQRNNENKTISISKAFNNNRSRVYHTFQNSKLRKKKSNIISQIKNKENENKIKHKLTYCKTDKDFYTIKKEEKNNINNENFDKNIKKKLITTNSFIIKNKTESNIILKPEKYKTTEKKKKIKNSHVKDISMKDNCFNIDNSNKNNNIKVLKISLNYNDNNNSIKNFLNNRNIETKIFKPNMNIFKNTTINNKKITIQFLTEKNMNNNNNRSPVNINKNSYGKNIICNKGVKEDNKNDNSNNVQQSKNYSESYIDYKHPLNIPQIYKSPLNSELSQFTFKKNDALKENKQTPELITEKRRNELNKLINFTNQF